MENTGSRLRLVELCPERVATVAVGGLVAVGRRSAAQWYGWPLLRPPSDVELVVPPNRHPTPWPGARIIRQTLDGSEVIRVRDVPVTDPLRTALDLAAHLPTAEALGTLDAACRLGAVRAGVLRKYLNRVAKPKQRTLATLLDPDRASIYESLFAYLMHRAGILEPQCQFVVRRGAVFLARADFAWPHRMVIVEIDGYAYHSDRTAFQADRRRQNALVNAGWRVLRFTPEDLLLRPDVVIAEVRAALSLPQRKINAPKIKPQAA